MLASDLLRLSEKQMPTSEKRRSTLADVAGQLRYCRAITERLRNFLALCSHHAMRDSEPLSFSRWRSDRREFHAAAAAEEGA